MADLIDRKAILEELNNSKYTWQDYDEMEYALRHIPAVDAVEVPCKVDNTVYSMLDDLGRLHECKVCGIYIGSKEWKSYVELEPIDYRGRRYGAAFGAFGKTVFLTREEAENALAERREENVAERHR